MAGGDSLVAHPRGCRPRSGRCRRKPGRRTRQSMSSGRRRRGASGSGPARHTGGVVTRPPPGSIPDAPGSYQFYDADGPGPLRGQGQVPAPPPELNYFQDPASLPPRTAQMVRPGRPRRVDRGGQRGRGPPARAQPHQAAPAPLQRPAEGRQELPVAGRHRQRRVAPPGGGPGPQAQRGALLRPLRQRRGHPGRPSTCSCAPSRCAPARTPSSAATSAWGGPACCSTSSGARGRASARSTTRSTTGWWPTSSPSSAGDTGRARAAARGRDARGVGSPGVRAGARPPGQARGRADGRGASRWSSAGPRTSTSSAWPRTSWRPPCRSSTSAGQGGGPARSSWTRWRT